MYPPLEAAWAKYNRAARDLRILRDNTRRFLESEPYRIDVELEASTGWWVVRTRIDTEPPPVFGVLVGSLAHQLYSALNHVAFALAVGHLGEEAAYAKRFELDFPITDAQSQFDHAKVLQHIDVAAATALERLQPYHRPPGSHGHIEHPLLLLKELADADKHRVLAASYGSVDLGQVLSGEALVWDKAAAEAGDFHRTAPEAARQGGLRRGDEIARLRFRRGNEVANPRVEPQPLVDMVFESDSWGGITLWNLGSCVATADQCISQLAPFFPDQRWPPETHDPTSPYEW